MEAEKAAATELQTLRAQRQAELELTWADIDALEQAVTHKKLPATTGFFFGSDADELYYESDLAFIKAARAELFLGLRVFYNSSW